MDGKDGKEDKVVQQPVFYTVSNITPHRNETVTGTWQTLMSDTTFALSITHVRKIEGTPCQVLVTCFMRCRYLPFALASLKSACPQRVDRVGRQLCVLRCLAVQAKLQSTDDASIGPSIGLPYASCIQWSWFGGRQLCLQTPSGAAA
ncbi:unnamed protein product [Effrenium voratum]|nr:unnamed protein product [Effrenium voratum]